MRSSGAMRGWYNEAVRPRFEGVPGLAEEEIVAETCLLPLFDFEVGSRAIRVLAGMEECRDRRKTEWSRRGLVAKNIPPRKSFPLMYDIGNHAALCHKSFPVAFERSNPLRVLFLGNLCVRKGIAESGIRRLSTCAPVSRLGGSSYASRFRNGYASMPPIECRAADGIAAIAQGCFAWVFSGSYRRSALDNTTRHPGHSNVAGN